MQRTSFRLATQAIRRPRLTITCSSTVAVPPRLFHSTTRTSSFQNIFDTDSPNDPLARPRLVVSKLTPEGFHLTDGLIIPGGAVFLDNRAFLWDVDPPKVDQATGRGIWEEWGVERFKIFETVIPRPEILLLGTGQTVIPPPPSIRQYISSLGIQLDVMDSRNACSTFNLLSEEGRTVGAALMPLKNVDPRSGGRR